MQEEDKLDPDELLRAIQREEQQQELGRLKIFFGMSAGVGKTYTMLQEAQEQLSAGLYVLIGTINTHGRKETERLLGGLPILPEKWVKYKDTVFEELDLDKILELKPDLVLIDELAHTNVPGSKHPKRWQDVIEILDAGIDVFTTLNVQHVESRKDIVESLTGIQIRETVPDLVLERAATIEIIDISPNELLQRLKEGKVYLGDQSQIAARNFFLEENLTALREIALRFTAEKVDHDLHGILHGKGWRTRERLMVAISPSPSSQQVIRSARRLAFELDAPWVVVYVDTGKIVTDEEQKRLNSHFNLARELGAEVFTTHDLDISAALKRIAQQKDITQLVMGRSPKKGNSLFNFFRGSLIDRLESQNKYLDLVILRQDKITDVYKRAMLPTLFTSFWQSYLKAFLFVIGLTIIGILVNPLIGYKAVGFIFLLGILILSFFIGKGPIFIAATLSSLSWGILFIPSFFSYSPDPEDIVMLVVYFCVSTIMGILTSRLTEQDQFLHQREEKMEHLYEIERDISNATNIQYLRLNVCSRLENIFPGKFDILIKNSDGDFVIESQLSIISQEKEQAAAIWTFQNDKISGWSTDTLPSAEGMYFPIKFSKSTVGVLVYHPKRERPLSMEEVIFIQTVTQHLGIYLERTIFEEKMHRQEYTRQTEKVHHAVFNSLNRGFYTLLEGVFTVLHQFPKEKLDPETIVLLKKLESLVSNIKLSADNIITISELESGFVHFKKESNSIKELIEKCVSAIKPLMDRHKIQVNLPDTTLFLPFDLNLMKMALENLIVNALEYSSVDRPVFINVDVFEKEFVISVIDKGPGIREDVMPFIFEKFYRIPGTSTHGMGLGLAVVRAVLDIHQGRIEVKNLESGTVFSMILPI